MAVMMVDEMMATKKTPVIATQVSMTRSTVLWGPMSDPNMRIMMEYT